MGHMRHLSTSNAAFTKFQRVLRKPVPKAKVLNVGNINAWKESGMDVGLAQEMLQDGLVKRQEASSRKANKNIADLIKQAASLPDLQLIAEELGPHLMPPLIAMACVRAVQLGQSAGPGWQAPARSCIEQYTLHLVPRVSMLSTAQLASVLYAMARAGYREGRIGPALMQELTVVNGQRVLAAAPHEVASIMQSVSALGLHSSQQGSAAWPLLQQAAAQQLPQMQAHQVAQVVRALANASDRSSPLWDQAQNRVVDDAKTWVAVHAEALAGLMHSAASAGKLRPELLQAAASQFAGNGHLVPGRVPEALAGVSPSALASLAYAFSAAHNDDTAAHMLACISSAAASSIIRFPPASLATLLTAMARAGVSDERLVRLAADVLRIRGFSGLGADSAAAVLHALVLLGMRDAAVAGPLAGQGATAVASASPRSLALAAWSLTTIGQPQGAGLKFLEACSDRLTAAAGVQGPQGLCPTTTAKAMCALAMLQASGSQLPAGLQKLAVKLADALAAHKDLHAAVKDTHALKELRSAVPPAAASMGVPADHPLHALLTRA